MKKEIYTCDYCGEEWNLTQDAGAYILDHISLNGAPIIGDNRIPRGLYFCKKCFNSIYEVISKD